MLEFKIFNTISFVVCAALIPLNDRHFKRGNSFCVFRLHERLHGRITQDKCTFTSVCVSAIWFVIAFLDVIPLHRSVHFQVGISTYSPQHPSFVLPETSVFLSVSFWQGTVENENQKSLKGVENTEQILEDNFGIVNGEDPKQPS